jgi:hypothetical protein
MAGLHLQTKYLITLTLVLLAVGDIPKMRLASRLVIFGSNPPL